jgi:hypothetical protein
MFYTLKIGKHTIVFLTIVGKCNFLQQFTLLFEFFYLHSILCTRYCSLQTNQINVF